MDTHQARSFLLADPSRTGIFVDFDGTLSRIVDRPEEAAPVEGALDALEALAERFAVVAIVSGRSLEDLRGRAGCDGVILAGAYGRERSDRPGRRATEGWETVAVAASGAVADLEGAVVERKGAGVALHFRRAPELADQIRSLAESLAGEYGLEVRPGRLVYELVTPGPGKGEAIATLARERDLERLLIAGDDVADAEAFRVVRELDAESVLVAVASEEAPEGLVEEADIALPGPDELVAFLRDLAG